MEETANLLYTDKLCFNKNIVYEKIGNKILVISPETANWIVLNSNKEKNIFDKILFANNIGDIFNNLNDKENAICKKIIAKILSRKFAGINNNIEPIQISTSDLMYCYLTNGCNLNCPHCYMNAGIKSKNELSLLDWEKVLKNFKESGGKGVTFTGGEPLMNKDFHDIVKYTNKIGLKIAILSNGLLWTDDLILELYKYIDEIQISIDGVDEESNSFFRGKNHFYLARKNAIMFANLGVKTSIATTFSLEDLKSDVKDKYKKFVNSISKECDNKIVFRLSKKMLSGRNVNYTKKENDEYYKKTLEIENYSRPNSNLENFIEDHNMYNMIFTNCGFGGITVSSTGNVYFCNRTLQLKSLGNVKDHTINYYIQLGEKIKRLTSVDNVDPCKKCNLRYICGGGCRIDDFNFNGDINKNINDIKQIQCNKEKILFLKKKMIDSFLYYYKF